MDLQDYSSTPPNPSPGFVYNASHRHRPSNPSSGSAHSTLPIPHPHQPPPIDSCSPIASHFGRLSVGRPPLGAPLNAVGWPIVVPTGANVARAGASEGHWRRHVPTSYETAVSRFAAQAFDAPFAAFPPLFPIEVNDNYLPPQMPTSQHRQLEEERLRHVQQLQLQQQRAEVEAREMQQATTQWLEKLVECDEEGDVDEQGYSPRVDDRPMRPIDGPMRPLTRWQRQCEISNEYLTRSLESDEESELMALMSQESSQDDEKPTDESFCRQLANPLWSRSLDTEHANESSHGAMRRVRDAVAAETPSATQQLHFRRLQECHPIEMTPESIDDYIYKSMKGEKKAQTRSL